jgi:hypothetical protein
MRGCAEARRRQYFSYFAFLSARDLGDVIAKRSFAMFYPCHRICHGILIAPRAAASCIEHGTS